jgi:hypothetical protein
VKTKQASLSVFTVSVGLEQGYQHKPVRANTTLPHALVNSITKADTVITVVSFFNKFLTKVDLIYCIRF